MRVITEIANGIFILVLGVVLGMLMSLPKHPAIPAAAAFVVAFVAAFLIQNQRLSSYHAALVLMVSFYESSLRKAGVRVTHDVQLLAGEGLEIRDGRVVKCRKRGPTVEALLREKGLEIRNGSVVKLGKRGQDEQQTVR